jgi:catechol 2,3-dioxygenase-like lactoylglutathione lyase family enzyme
MPTPFRTLHHICIVVHDLDRAAKYYESIGIGPFVEYPALSEYSEGLQVPNPEHSPSCVTCRPTERVTRRYTGETFPLIGPN